MHWKTALLFVTFFASNASGQYIKGQISLHADQTGYPLKVNRQYKLMDRYYTGDPVSFQGSQILFYKKKKVKQINIKSEDNKLIYSYRINKNGTIKDFGHYISDKYFYSKTVILDSNATLQINQRWRNGRLQKSDSIFSHNRHYQNGDTIIYYSYQVRIIHIKGDIINERNTYYNENYLGKPNRTMLNYGLFIGNYNFISGKAVAASEEYVPEIPNYFDIPFKTDYRPEKVYLAEYSIIGDGGFVIGEKELEKNRIFEHSNFQNLPLSDNQMFFVDGEDFIQPLPENYQDDYMNHFTCHGGYETYNPPIKNGWVLDVSNGLIESAYCDYWEEDKSPEALLENARNDSLRWASSQAKSANNNSNLNNITAGSYYNDGPSIKIKYADRKTKYCYEYEFYE